METDFFPEVESDNWHSDMQVFEGFRPSSIILYLPCFAKVQQISTDSST
jgi:hypothetical protein